MKSTEYRHAVRAELGATMVLALPIALTQVAHVSLGFIDTVMVGRLGPESLAGVALGNSLFFATIVMCMGVVMAVSPMVSQALGAGLTDPIGRSVRQGQWLAILLAVVVSVLFWNAAPILGWLGQEEARVVDAAAYLRALMWGAFPWLGFIGLRSFVEAAARPRPVTAIAFFGVGLNIFLNWVLMYGNLGAPALGIVGTGWASAIVYWIDFLLLTGFVAMQPDFRRYQIFSRIGRPDPDYFRRLFRIGWPIGAMLGIETALFMMTLMMMGWIGTSSLAAHQIAIQCAAFTFMVPLGIALATTVRVGHAAGRGDSQGVRIAGGAGMALATVFMMAAGLAFLLLPRPIVGLFLDLGDPGNREVVELAVVLLGVAAVFQVTDGLQVTAGGALRGLKDTRVPMLIGLVSYWGVGLVSGYLLGFRAGLGPRGLWWGLVLGLAVAAVMLILRFRSQSSNLVPFSSEPFDD